jgi:hypothetical protein
MDQHAKTPAEASLTIAAPGYKYRRPKYGHVMT